MLTPSVAQILDYDAVAKHPRILLHKGDITAMKAFAAKNTRPSTRLWTMMPLIWPSVTSAPATRELK